MVIGESSDSDYQLENVNGDIQIVIKGNEVWLDPFTCQQLEIINNGQAKLVNQPVIMRDELTRLRLSNNQEILVKIERRC